MKSLLLDTSYLIALEASDDQNHQAALRHWQNLLKSLPPLVTTSYIFDEAVTFFNSRDYHSKAVELGNNLIQSASVEFIHVDEAMFYEGWGYFQKHQDKSYSLTLRWGNETTALEEGDIPLAYGASHRKEREEKLCKSDINMEMRYGAPSGLQSFFVFSLWLAP